MAWDVWGWGTLGGPRGSIVRGAQGGDTSQPGSWGSAQGTPRRVQGPGGLQAAMNHRERCGGGGHRAAGPGAAQGLHSSALVALPVSPWHPRPGRPRPMLHPWPALSPALQGTDP